MKDSILQSIAGGRSKKKDIMADTDCTLYQWNKFIRQLVAEGVVLRNGTRKAATYTAV